MQIERASFGKLAYPRRLFRELAGTCGKLFFVARSGRTLAGYLVACVEGQTAEIISVAVDPAFRGAGIGRGLVEHLLGALRDSGINRMELMVRTENRAAIGLYRAFRFRRVRRVPGYYEDGADGWLMRKLL